MSQAAGSGVEAFSVGVIKGSFVVVGTLKAQGGFTVYKVRFKVSILWSQREDLSGSVYPPCFLTLLTAVQSCAAQISVYE